MPIKEAMLVLNIFMTSLLVYPSVASHPSPRIAIIGGGIGGTSCAYFLRQLFQDKAELTLFERDTIGGRLNLLDVDGDFYEAGAAVIRPSNKYMKDFAKLLGLGVPKPTPSRVGIYDGKQFVFEGSEWHFVTMAKFFWRYGFSPFSLFKWVETTLNDFDRIYSLQEKEYAFTTLSGLLESLNPSFPKMSQESLATLLEKKNYSQLFLDEFVQSVNMINYGQTNNITGFAGFVSLSGANSNLWSIQGGNKLVPEGILEKSKATVKVGDVSEVRLMPDGTYAVDFYEPSKQNVSTEHFDITIIACPLVQNYKNIKFTNFPSDFSEFESVFHPLVTTLVQGELNPVAFSEKDAPTEILTYKQTLGFNSVSKVIPVSNTESEDKSGIYRVFSEKPLTEEVIKQLFQHVKEIKQKEWIAYPHYEDPKQLPPFMLNPRLYYLNAIELATSEMEMSAVGGKNVALLAYNLWHNLEHKVDYHEEVQKDEL